MGDLPYVPCYESDNCGSVYNCGGISGDWACNQPTESSGLKTCPDGTKEGYCWGNDPNFCSGIYESCPGPEFNCENTQINPIFNILGTPFGCTIGPEGPIGNCKEFTNPNDQVSGCQDVCWNIGGREEVNQTCENLDYQSCESLGYFCNWDNDTMTCSAHKSDPWFSLPKEPDSKYTIEITPNDCNGDLCKKVEGTPTGNDAWFVTCARSSYDSQKMTSYAEGAHICCLHKPATNEKICISNPRCQFVQNTCDCGFKDISANGDPEKLAYMCAANYNTQ